MNCLCFAKRAAAFACVVLTCLILPVQANAQCPVVSHCFPDPANENSLITYVFTPMNVTTSNSVIIPDSNPNDLQGPQVKSTDIACVLVNGAEKHIDMRVTVYDATPGITAGNFGSGFTGFTNGTISFFGERSNVNRSYKFVTEFFETGTSTALNINVLQQVQDIDGDGDWNFDYVRDDPRCNTTLVQVRDDYSWARGFTSSDTSDITHIYQKKNGDTTYFFSSGTNNTAYTGIAGRTATPSTQSFLLAYINKNKTEFGYNSGQYGGVFIDYTAQNLVVVPRCTTLPVTWVDFTGTEKDGAASLYWKVSNETDVLSYDVERSINGTQFTKTGSLDYRNNTQGADNEYRFTDLLNNTGSTIVYYRIRQNDIDGKFSYSKVIAIRLNRDSNGYSLFPNPVIDRLHINIISSNQEKATITLFNAIGQVQHSQKIQLLKGNNAVTIDETARLPKGIYSVTIKTPGRIITEKLVKL